MPTRVSDLFHLGMTQASLDFVDVDVESDNELYVDPSAVRRLGTRWGRECTALIQDFFDTIERALNANNRDAALHYLGELREPNETHLGISAAAPAGRGLGGGARAVDFYNALAARRNLFNEFEEIALLTEGVDRDILSDMTTNIIREPLINYTQSMCEFYGITGVQTVASGPMWDPKAHDWYDDFVDLPMSPSGPLILVPKVIARRKLFLRYQEYFWYFILPFRQRLEIKQKSGLVQRRKNGAAFVTKKDLVDRYGQSKTVAAAVTRQYTQILESYRQAKRVEPCVPLSHADIGEEPDWDKLLTDVTSCNPGKRDAKKYEDAIQRLLTALFYPWLTNPVRERQLDNRKRRIDITYDNDAASGFFWWVNENYRAPTVAVECKNYTEDPTNPEVDQLAGRFSNGRGWFGMLVCRTVDNMKLLIERCRDCARDRKSWILPLTDDDLRALVTARKNSSDAAFLAILRSRFDGLLY